MGETPELAKKLAHRNAVNEGEAAPKVVGKPKNVYMEFAEFTRKQITQYESFFNKYDTDNSKFLDQTKLQYMMEKLECPQSFFGLKKMIQQVDEDQDGKLSFREFLLIFRKASAGELEEGSGLDLLQEELGKLSEIDVDETGVGGAKNFFEAKAKAVSSTSKYEDEMMQEREERKKEIEEKRIRKEEFKKKAQNFDAV